MKCNSYFIFFETIATPLRIDIINALRKKSMNVSDLCQILGEEQSKVSHNLKRLSSCNILNSKREGKNIIYSLNKETIEPLFDLVEKHVKCNCTNCDHLSRIERS